MAKIPLIPCWSRGFFSSRMNQKIKTRRTAIERKKKIPVAITFPIRAFAFHIMHPGPLRASFGSAHSISTDSSLCFCGLTLSGDFQITPAITRFASFVFAQHLRGRTDNWYGPSFLHASTSPLRRTRCLSGSGLAHNPAFWAMKDIS